MKTETTYTTLSYTVKGNTFSVMIATGKSNYVSVTKMTNNPFKTLGKQFNNFDEAVKSYKSADMKAILLMAESGLTQTI